MVRYSERIKQGGYCYCFLNLAQTLDAILETLINKCKV